MGRKVQGRLFFHEYLSTLVVPCIIKIGKSKAVDKPGGWSLQLCEYVRIVVHESPGLPPIPGFFFQSLDLSPHFGDGSLLVPQMGGVSF
jgi:hypothetical protein